MKQTECSCNSWTPRHKKHAPFGIQVSHGLNHIQSH